MMEMPGHGLNDMNCVWLQTNGTRPRSFSDYWHFSKARHGPYLNHWATVRRTCMLTSKGRLNPETDENHMVAREQLMLRPFRGLKVLTNLLEISRACWTNLLQASPRRYTRLNYGSTLWIPYQRRMYSSSRYHQRTHMQKPFQRLEECCWPIAELIDITQ